MSNVDLVIGGRKFTVACEDGEEHHIADLARMIDRKVVESGAGAGQTETRMLLFGALMLADEVHELRHRAAAPPGAPTVNGAVDMLHDHLANLAGRLENLANQLESEPDYT